MKRLAPRPPWLMRLHERQRIREVREYLQPGGVMYVNADVRALQLAVRRGEESARRWASVKPGDTVRVKRYP